jgi:16S rRNA processing protein RimM
MTMADAPPQLLRAAVVRRAHGVRGGVRVESLGDDPRRFRSGLVVVVEETGEELVVRSARVVAGNEVLLALKGIDTPEAVARLRGQYLCVRSEDARSLGADEWFVWQLVGLEAIDAGGTVIGTVSDVEPGTVHDILVVDTAEGARRFPMVRAFVERVDVQAGRIVLTPWEED